MTPRLRDNHISWILRERSTFNVGRGRSFLSYGISTLRDSGGNLTMEVEAPLPWGPRSRVIQVSYYFPDTHHEHVTLTNGRASWGGMTTDKMTTCKAGSRVAVMWFLQRMKTPTNFHGYFVKE